MTEQVMVVDANKCTGCKICELVCSMAKQEVYSPTISYIRVIRNSDLDVNIPVLKMGCDYCGTCVEWCFPHALKIVSIAEAAILRKGSNFGSFPIPRIAE